MKKNKIFTMIALGLVGLTLVLLCTMGIVAKLVGPDSTAGAVLKIVMYATFGLSAVAFIVTYVLDVKRRRDGRK